MADVLDVNRLLENANVKSVVEGRCLHVLLMRKTDESSVRNSGLGSLTTVQTAGMHLVTFVSDSNFSLKQSCSNLALQICKLATNLT
ncbi:hypothetical protein AVEN_269603-1 [Araneus ventricosus]|uniref:Uncharacterized protein n=1 Tax=Araneus ventricosus TaxID=182803 RepID=A0A4Y2CCD3_ARAVE|nr:hypothetical protein AVEN_269603-1 [Araneus ventricosus]